MTSFELIISVENMSSYAVAWEVGLLMSDVWGRRRGGEFNHYAALNARATCFPASLLHLCSWKTSGEHCEGRETRIKAKTASYRQIPGPCLRARFFCITETFRFPTDPFSGRVGSPGGRTCN